MYFGIFHLLDVTSNMLLLLYKVHDFMMGCEACNERFHGDCVSVTKAEGKASILFTCFSTINLTLVYRHLR